MKARDLPWRRTRDPYRIWVSEVMLQQTTVKAVIPYFNRWVQTFPDIQGVAQASEQKILKMWQGLGYYRRVLNLQRSAKIICHDYSGKIPRDPDLLKTLPGFGPYTVAAVLSIAFDKPLPLIDANVRRVMMRFLGVNSPSLVGNDKNIRHYLQKQMPSRGSRFLNQALMELGALVCRSQNPQCLVCPLKSYCRAYRDGTQECVLRKTTAKIKDIVVVVAVIENKGKFLIQKRPAHGLFAGLWEFPGGKVMPGETFSQALAREINEELGVKACCSKPLLTIRHYYTSFCAHLHVRFCLIEGMIITGKNRKWVSRNALLEYPMPSGSARIVEKLQQKTIEK